MPNFNFDQAKHPDQTYKPLVRPTRLPYVFAGLFAVMNVVLVVALIFALGGKGNAEPERPSDKKILAVAEQAIKDYAENVARVCESVAKDVREKKITTKAALSSQSNARSQGARLESFKPIGEMDNEFIPEKMEGREEDVAAYLEAMAKGHRRAVK